VSGTRKITAAALAAMVVLAAAGGPAAAAPADDVYAALGVDKVPADYIVMVDISGSMQQSGRYAAVKDSLRAFLAALAPDDQVELGTFADKATIVRQGPVGRSVDEVVAALPATATGARTDIGAAIEAALAQLERPGAPAVATDVLLTHSLL
jgi:Mg-chelatase subunit ChlD